MFKNNKIVGGGGVGSSNITNKLNKHNQHSQIEHKLDKTHTISSNFDNINHCENKNKFVNKANFLNIQGIENKQDTHTTREHITRLKRTKESKEYEDCSMNRIQKDRRTSIVNNKGTIYKGLAIKGNIFKNATLQIVMWLMLFTTLLVLALQPILQSRNNMSMAGGPANNQYYANAPMTVIGGSVDESTYTINDGTKPLFTANGVNADVLMELLNAVNSSSVWGSKTAPTSGSSVTYLSAKDFGNYGDQSSWAESAQGNAQIVLKLLDDTTTPTNNVDDAAAQYWQVVYRSTSANEDVLTLYMTNSYMMHRFNPWLSQATEEYRYEGNYSQSEIRDQAVLPTYETMASTYSQLDQYVVTPSEVPGLWQSSAYQTSYNSKRSQYSTGIGTSGYGSGSSSYNLENGLDGLSGGYSSWSGTVESAYTDKLWVPSAFEVMHTGYGSSDDGTSPLQDTGNNFDEGEGVSYVSNSSSASTTLSNVTSGEDGRTGLWELNGYDRAWGDTSVTSFAWLRSGYSNGIGSARAVYWDGNVIDGSVDAPSGVRVALHLNLKSLASNLLDMDSVPTPPTYYYSVNLQADTQIEADTNALLVISSEKDQAMIYRVGATTTQINITMPKLVVGRTYTITVINGEISGTLSATGGATVTQTPYTFVCDTEDAEITLSGLTIS